MEFDVTIIFVAYDLRGIKFQDFIYFKWFAQTKWECTLDSMEIKFFLGGTTQSQRQYG